MIIFVIVLQGHVDAQQPFPNGSAATLSLMPGLTLLPGQFGAPGLAEMPPTEPTKLDAPSWGIPDAVQDKQHPVFLYIHFRFTLDNKYYKINNYFFVTYRMAYFVQVHIRYRNNFNNFNRKIKL